MTTKLTREPEEKYTNSSCVRASQGAETTPTAADMSPSRSWGPRSALTQHYNDFYAQEKLLQQLRIVTTARIGELWPGVVQCFEGFLVVDKNEHY